MSDYKTEAIYKISRMSEEDVSKLLVFILELENEKLYTKEEADESTGSDKKY